MEELSKKAINFKFNSFQYESPENAIKIIHNEDYLLAAEKYQDGIRYFWACDTIDSLIDGINELSKEISGHEVMLEFIPPEFVEGMEEEGFSIVSQWIDFWIRDLQNQSWDTPITVDIRPLCKDEVPAASEVTKSCKGISRGFYGEDEAFIIEWLEDNDNEIFAAIKDGMVVGVCFMSTYQGKSGKVAWLRELAVNPKYQYQGIGRSLAKIGLEWGKSKGASLSFLATDMENSHSINLYKKLGYVPQEGPGQINMSKRF